MLRVNELIWEKRHFYDVESFYLRTRTVFIFVHAYFSIILAHLKIFLI